MQDTFAGRQQTPQPTMMPDTESHEQRGMGSETGSTDLTNDHDFELDVNQRPTAVNL